MALLSVIIPFYNSEQYLSQCIESIQNQTFSDLEILCVDDGSTDASAEICKRLAKSDSRIQLFSKENGGAPSARNFGMRQAMGKYLTFVDADDWLESEMYQVMVQMAEQSDADMAIVGYFKDFEGSSRPMENQKPIPDMIEDAEQLFRYAFIRDEYRNFGAFVWNKLFRKQILDDGKLSFDEKLTRGDDVLFFAEAALRCKRAVYCGKHFYHYRQYDTSYTKAISLERGESILTAYQKVIAMGSAQGFTEDTIDYLRRFYAYHAMLLLKRALDARDAEKIKWYREQVRIYADAYRRKNKEQKERISEFDDLLRAAATECV